MTTEQQIASIVVGWVLVALAAGSAYYVHWMDKRYLEAKRRQKQEGQAPT